MFGAAGERKASWSAPALWRFGKWARAENGNRDIALSISELRSGSTKSTPGQGTACRAVALRRRRSVFGVDEKGKRRLNPVVIDTGRFKDLQLHGGFIIRGIELTEAPIVDAIGREAVAQTSAIAKNLRLLIRAGLSEEELSITLYHEILEAASVAIADPPAGVMDFNEADFERSAREAHQRWGNVSPANLSLLCNSTDFDEYKV